MRIGIVGVGNIGMRYVQGIRKKFPDVEMCLVDNEARLEELKGLEELQRANVLLLDSLDKVHGPIDVFVVSTSCEPRLSIYRQCLTLEPRYVILEKYLFTSPAEFEDSLSLNGVPTFVNQWMYGSGAFDRIFQGEATSVELRGSGWGLACNAVHWIDVFQRHMKITRVTVGAGTTTTHVLPSKRDGYEEVLGEWIFADAASDKTFKLVDSPEDCHADGLRIIVDGVEYVFDYTAIRRGDTVLARFPYFSDQIGGIIGEITEKGTCSLPLLEASVSQHLLIEEILAKLDRRPRIT